MNENVLSAQVLFSPWSSKCASMKCLMSGVEEGAQQSFNVRKSLFLTVLMVLSKEREKGGKSSRLRSRLRGWVPLEL